MRKTLAACAITALAVGGTTATAASLITSKDIADGSILNRDIKEGTVSLNRLTPGLQQLVTKAGTPGKDGAKGEAGAAGSAGSAGAAGTNGVDGKNGINGNDGKDGKDGDKGDKGDTGAPGADGLNSDVPRTVTASNLRGWQLLPAGTNPDPAPNGVAEFVSAAKAPLGNGALRLMTETGKNVSAIVPLRAGSDTPRLSELTTATFSTFKIAQPTQPNVDVALKITVVGANTGTASGFTTLVFEGAYNRDQNPDATGTWQRWYVRSGKLWSSRALVGAPNGNCGQTVGCTIDEIVANSPNAVVTSVRLEVGQNSGAGWAGFDSVVDDVRLGFDGDFIRYDLGA